MNDEIDILIAEDSPTQAEHLRHILEQQGYRVSVAHNGRAALSSVGRHKPTMVLSDIVMPEMDGFELCRQIRADQALQDLPVILLTALSDPKDVIRALACGATNFIKKPYDEKHLLSRIHHVLANMDLRRTTTVEMGVNILFAGEHHFITAERLQILDLLLATYETAVRENDELNRVRDELQRLNEGLEQQVAERTEQVRQREALYRTLAETAQDSIFLIDSGFRVQYVNQFAARQLGRGPEELVGQPLAALFPVEEVAGQQAELQKILDTGEARYAERSLSFPGGEKWLGTSLMPIRDAAGQVEKVMGISRDLTKHKREERQREALQRLRTQVLQMRSEEDWEKLVVAFEDQLRDLVTFNACSISLVDQSKNTVALYHTLPGKVGAKTVSYIAPALRQALDTGRYVHRRNIEEVRAYEDEVGLWGQTVQSVVDVPFVGGTLAVNSTEEDAFGEKDIQLLEQFAQVAAEANRRLQDLRALAEAETRFRQAQKLESLGRLAGGVAHDFNNLLTIITGNTQLLLRTPGLEDLLRESVQEIQGAGERAVALVRQLLVFSRRQVLQPRILDLNQLVADVGKMLRRVIGEDIELVTALEPGLGRVSADPGQVEQVLMNLAVNARDAMPQGGSLVLETSNVELDEQYLATHAVEGRPGPYVLLSVSDTGMGMSPEVQARIFEPFFTTKEPGKGTGLGLATVYGIVRQSGGHIWVYSEVGQGTTFKIYLPRDGADGASLAAGGEAAELEWRGQETVVVVEDDELVRNLVVRLLRAQGYTVVEAQNGAEALQVLAQQGASVRLLLTDVVMPGMLGRELGEEVRRSYPQVKVVYMSGYSEHTALPQEVQANGERFIQKPFGPDDLARKVRQALDRR